MRTVSSLEERARSLLPADVYAYYAGGSGDEETLAANESAWSDVALRPRVFQRVGEVDPATTVLGTPVAAPILVAPTGFQGLCHPDAECATASGTAAAGSMFILSTRSSTRIEDVAAVAGPWWLQVYVFADRGLTRDLVTRAVAAGAQALMLTVDTPFVGRKATGLADVIPLDHLVVNFPSVAADHGRLADVVQSTDVTLDDIAWLTELSSGLPVIAKGVLRDDDAVAAVDAGVRGIVVSNHGGRQLDGAIASARALPEIADAVGDRAEVYVDGGVRRGVDVLRALALGARAVLVGRPVIWGLTVEGAAGVRGVLDGMRQELSLAMALAGVRNVGEATRDLVG